MLCLSALVYSAAPAALAAARPVLPLHLLLLLCASVPLCPAAAQPGLSCAAFSLCLINCQLIALVHLPSGRSSPQRS